MNNPIKRIGNFPIVMRSIQRKSTKENKKSQKKFASDGLLLPFNFPIIVRRCFV